MQDIKNDDTPPISNQLSNTSYLLPPHLFRFKVIVIKSDYLLTNLMDVS